MEPPKHLSKKSKELWKELEGLASRNLNGSDYLAIEQLCSESDVYRDAVEQLLGDKGFVSDRTGQVDPLVTVRNQASTNIRQAYKIVQGFIRQESKEERMKLRSVKNF